MNASKQKFLDRLSQFDKTVEKIRDLLTPEQTAMFLVIGERVSTILLLRVSV